ncbi:helix-turn-helix transcriptional regulator [Amycolatopsis sp. CA-230715]|uniref:helix-turn-helix transcriptional regulator n=1 Tax=Amycolatopsis sp. CA-230715 TaxID=2745196 RepID=UPI001C338B22|nr:helix-turn-helix transcriptional regulator [Amycolatopsis sp. CA-230715]QWF79762.1 HTH-type transcriptional activator RhaS [Amycolatopsis sp. CA-230715]
MPEVIETTDLAHATAVLSELYSSMRLSAHGDRRGLRIVQDRLGPVMVNRMTFGMSVDISVEPLGTVCVCGVRAGRASCRSGQDERRYRQDDVFLAAQPDRPLWVSLHDLDIDYTVIAPNLLGEVAQTGPREREPVRLLGHEPISPAAAAQWRRAFAFVRNEIQLMDNPLVRSHTARLLATVTLATFPSTALADPTIEDRHDANPATLRRAVAFIEANPDRDISMLDIANAASVTVRTVQLAFRRHLNTTPTAYLRRVRLACAHENLLAADSRDDTVTAIATRWGFPHLGRFAAAYRTAYGCSPRHTLVSSSG